VTRGRRQRRLLPTLSRIVLACALLLMAGHALWGLLTPVGGSAPQIVTIEPGESVAQVCAALAEKGLIRSPTALTLAAYGTGMWRSLQAGRHELDASMTAMEMLQALCRNSRQVWEWVTIPEGFTLRQIAAAVAETGAATAPAFAREATRPALFDISFPLPPDSLEGYLFPDTYRLDAESNARTVIAQMLRRFQEVVWRGLLGEREPEDGRSLHEVVILASLIEGEAKVDEERPVIAGVLMNRLRRGQKLECDASVQYALGEGRKNRLLYEDLQIESDYNTYLHEGLPPGPICSPGESSLRAALAPARTPYLYYVARADGSHVFSRTYREHLAAVAAVRAARERERQ